MRDVVHRTFYGTHTSSAVAKNDQDAHLNSEVSIHNINSGFKRKGRADITKSDGKHPTSYTAYDIECSQTGDEFSRQPNNFFDYTYFGASAHPTEFEILDWISFPLYYPVVPFSTIASARNSALAKIQNQQWNAAQTVAELKTTGKMLASTVSIALQAAAAAKKGKFAKAWKLIRGKGSVADSASNAFLGVTYGWRPLISDVNSALNLWQNGMARSDLLNIKTAVVDSKEADSKGNYSASGSWTVGCEIGITFGVDSPALISASGLGFLNPLLLGWEIIPLSFVVDWFLSVGNFLQGIGATVGMSFKHGYETLFAKAKGVTFTSTFEPFGREDIVFPSWKLNAFAMKREVLYSWPTSAIALRTGFNLNQLAASMALVQQRT